MRIIAVGFVLFFSLPAFGQTGNLSPQQLNELGEIIARQNELIERQSAILEDQNRQLQALKSQSLNTRPLNSQHSNTQLLNSPQNHPSFQPASSLNILNQEAAPGTAAEMLPAEPIPLINNGYDGGFTLMGPLDKLNDGKPKFLMNIGSWGQLRHNLFESRGPNLDENTMEFERLRLAFKGHAYTTNFQYFLQLDADSDSSAGSQNVDLLDYYGTYDFGNEFFGLEKKELRIRFGRWKVGFNRAREESGTKMQLSDRSTASVLFDFDRSVGFGLLGEYVPRCGKLFQWEFALTNGIDNAGFRPSRLGQLDDNFGTAARVNWFLTGDWGKDGHTDLEYRDIPAIRVGSGFTYTRPDRSGLLEFAFPRVVDTGRTIFTVLPNDVTAYNLFMFASDFNLKYQGFSLIWENYARQITGFSGGDVPSFFDYGFWLESGYFIVPQRVQLVSRYAFIKGDSSTAGVSNTSSDEIAGGIAYYFNGHNSKITFDVTYLNGAPVNDSALNIRPGDAGYLFRTTYQWKF